jgi:hypothetical protein
MIENLEKEVKMLKQKVGRLQGNQRIRIRQAFNKHLRRNIVKENIYIKKENEKLIEENKELKEIIKRLENLL